LKIAYIYADNDREVNCSLHYCIRPATWVNKIEGHSAITMHISEMVSNSEEAQKKLSDCDILVVERNFFSDTLTFMMYHWVRNKKIIAIFDDGYPQMMEKNPAYKFWHRGEVDYLDKEGIKQTGYVTPRPLVQFEKGLSIADAIQVPSLQLKQDWDHYGNVFHINNFIETDKYIDVKPLYPHDGIYIGWGGSLSHLESFTHSGVLKALKNVVRKYDNVKLIITGDKRVFDAITLPKDKKLFVPYVPEEQFLPLMKTFDIALAPLATEYDKRRSWIKVLEYMALQIPWIASNFPPYRELFLYGGMVENTTDAWEHALRHNVETIEERREYAKGLPFEFAMSQSYESNIPKTLEIYEKILNGEEL
jgi:glycosyltransferase involved in cell wall biosynthesis